VEIEKPEKRKKKHLFKKNNQVSFFLQRKIILLLQDTVSPLSKSELTNVCAITLYFSDSILRKDEYLFI
jgi:hypothetical protein